MKRPASLVIAVAIAAASALTVWGYLVLQEAKPDAYRQWKAVRQLESIALALEVYRQAQGCYPKALADLGAMPGGIALPGAAVVAKDPWENSFSYQRRCDDYTLASCGPDGSCSPPWSRGWAYGDADEDVVLKGGRWTRRPDLSLASSLRLGMDARADGNRGLQVTLNLSGVRRGSDGARVTAALFGPGRWLHAAGAGLERFDKGTLSWEVAQEGWVGTAVHSGLSPAPPTCIVAIARDNRLTEDDYRDNVAVKCSGGPL